MFFITPFTISFTKQKSHTIVNYICQVRILTNETKKNKDYIKHSEDR